MPCSRCLVHAAVATRPLVYMFGGESTLPGLWILCGCLPPRVVLFSFLSNVLKTNPLELVRFL